MNDQYENQIKDVTNKNKLTTYHEVGFYYDGVLIKNHSISIMNIELIYLFALVQSSHNEYYICHQSKQRKQTFMSTIFILIESL